MNMTLATTPGQALSARAVDTQGEHDPEQAPAVQEPLPAISIVESVKKYDPQSDLLEVRNLRARVAGYLGSRGVPSDMKEVTVLLSVLFEH